MKYLEIVAKLQKTNKYKGKKGEDVASAHMVASITALGVTLAVALSTIATIGIVTIVAILNGYDIESVSKYISLKAKKSAS